MAVDLLGRTVAVGDAYMLGGVVSRINEDGSIAVVLDPGGSGQRTITVPASASVYAGDASTGLTRADSFCTSLYAADAGSGVTSLTVEAEGAELLSMPVACAMRATKIAVSWRSSNEPSGAWTATLERRPSGGNWASVATFSISTTE